MGNLWSIAPDPRDYLRVWPAGDPVNDCPCQALFKIDVTGALNVTKNAKNTRKCPPAVWCTLNNDYNSVLYEHAVVTQAAAVASPQGTTSPPQLQGSFICGLT